MKILVTGSNGFLGSALVERLLARGETDIRCFVRPGSDRKRLDAVQARYPQIPLEIFQGSLGTVDDAVKALDGVDLVHHVAAGLSGAAADLFLSSAVASKNLLEAMAKTRFVKIVLISSFGVYGTAPLRPGAVLNEDTPMESQPEKRDLYSFAKWRQEKLFWEYRERYDFPLVVLRPGVIYGDSGSGMSARVGLNLFGLFLHLGGNNRLPLSYVENCAEAAALAGDSEEAVGNIYNVHDDDLPTCGQYLRRYRREVKKLRVVPVPYPAALLMSRLVENYHFRSKGQLPAVFTPYKTASSWKGTRFDNSRLKQMGWKQIVPTDEGIRRTFAYLREQAA